MKELLKLSLNVGLDSFLMREIFGLKHGSCPLSDDTVEAKTNEAIEQNTSFLGSRPCWMVQLEANQRMS